MKPAFPLLLCLLGAGSSALAQPAMHIVVQHSALAGFRYHAGDGIWNEMNVGDTLAVVREAGNPHDPHAVRIE